MQPKSILEALMSMASFGSMGSGPSTPHSQHLNVTAISAENGSSVLQCWQLAAPFLTSHTAGTQGARTQQMGSIANVSYTALPPKYFGGRHNAPRPQ